MYGIVTGIRACVRTYVLRTYTLYMYMYMCVCIYIYIHTHIQTELHANKVL